MKCGRYFIILLLVNLTKLEHGLCETVQSTVSIGVCDNTLRNPGGKNSVTLSFTEDEFLSTFSQVFHMSDGSQLQMTTTGSNSSDSILDSYVVTNILSIMGDVGVTHSVKGNSVTVCESDLLKVIMLASLGNFVTSPVDEVIGSASIAQVVVDVYTGRLVVVIPYNSLRSYFLETLLVVSVIAIARLSLVRSVYIGVKSK